MIHSAFREALEKQFDTLHSNSNLSATLYHGCPNIGKSCLSLATAYYLSLAHGTSMWVKFKHNPEGRHQEYLDVLEEHINEKCVVIDQLNTSILHPSFLTKPRDDGCLPFTMFTSGHCPPPKEWLDKNLCGDLYLRVIDLVMTKEDVKQLLESRHNIILDAKAIWEVTKNYGLLSEYLLKLQFVTDRQQLSSIVYDIEALESSQMNVAEQLWLLWPEFFQQTDQELKEGLSNIEPKNFPISSEKMQCMSLSLAKFKMRENDAILTVLKWLVLVKDQQEASSNHLGYLEMQTDECHYIFADSSQFKTMLLSARKSYNPHMALTQFKNTYKLVRLQFNTSLNSCAGDLFEEYIRLCTCVHDVGISFHFQTSTLVKVNRTGKAGTSKEILDSIPCSVETQCTDDHEVKVWLDLNKPNKIKFKGYDFAFLYILHNVALRNYQVRNLFLFQATVSPSRKTQSQLMIMENVAKDIAEQVKKNHLLEMNAMKSIFLLPRDSTYIIKI